MQRPSLVREYRESGGQLRREFAVTTNRHAGACRLCHDHTKPGLGVLISAHAIRLALVCRDCWQSTTGSVIDAIRRAAA